LESNLCWRCEEQKKNILTSSQPSCFFGHNHPESTGYRYRGKIKELFRFEVQKDVDLCWTMNKSLNLKFLIQRPLCDLRLIERLFILFTLQASWKFFDLVFYIELFGGIF
jgi:hypothetical protein